MVLIFPICLALCIGKLFTITLNLESGVQMSYAPRERRDSYNQNAFEIFFCVTGKSLHNLCFTSHVPFLILFVLIEQEELIKLRELRGFHEENGHNLGGRERHDSTDSIEDSMETKRLHSEISKLQAECQHWKSIANGVVSGKRKEKQRLHDINVYLP